MDVLEPLVRRALRERHVPLSTISRVNCEAGEGPWAGPRLVLGHHHVVLLDQLLALEPLRGGRQGQHGSVGSVESISGRRGRVQLPMTSGSLPPARGRLAAPAVPEGESGRGELPASATRRERVVHGARAEAAVLGERRLHDALPAGAPELIEDELAVLGHRLRAREAQGGVAERRGRLARVARRREREVSSGGRLKAQSSRGGRPGAHAAHQEVDAGGGGEVWVLAFCRGHVQGSLQGFCERQAFR